MKKILTALFATFLLLSNANAKEGLFVEINANQSHAKHQISEQAIPRFGGYNNQTIFTENKTSQRDIGVGGGVGYKKVIANIVSITPELFFDQLNNRAKDPYADNGANAVYNQDVMILRNRYGAKLNAGVILADKLDLFVTAGLAYTNYAIQWNSNYTKTDNVGQLSYSAKKLAPIYGVGLAYDITDNIFIRTTYDHQSFNIRYGLDGWRSKVNLNVLKIGVGYIF